MWRTILQVSLIRHPGWIRAVACIGLLPGCYGPNPEYLGPASETTASDANADGATSDSGDTADESAIDAGNSSDANDSGDLGDDGNSSDDGPTSCADGVPQPGELCFTVETMLDMPVQSLATGDFDHDGHLDLGVAAQSDLRVLFGDGSGGFPLQLDLPEIDGAYLGAAVGDLDEDGHLDLLFSNSNADSIVLHASNGNMTFAPPVSFAVGEQPVGLALALLDGDASLDVVVADKGDDAVSVLINEGSGQLDEPGIYGTDGSEPWRLLAGRFDGDSALDIAVANRNGEKLAILRGFGNGGFADAHTHSLAGRPNDLVAADFDLDGALDLAVVIGDRDVIEVVFGDGWGDFVGEHVELEVGDQPVALAVLDLDNDGTLDLVILNRDDADVGVVFGDADQPGQFLAQQTLVGLGGFNGLSAVAVGDLNGDEVADLAIGGDELRTLISNP
jgi:hypothetical protein